MQSAACYSGCFTPANIGTVEVCHSACHNACHSLPPSLPFACHSACHSPAIPLVYQGEQGEKFLAFFKTKDATLKAQALKELA